MTAGVWAAVAAGAVLVAATAGGWCWRQREQARWDRWFRELLRSDLELLGLDDTCRNVFRNRTNHSWEPR